LKPVGGDGVDFNKASASARHRVSPYELVSFEKAMDVIFHEVQPLNTSKQPVSSFVPSFQRDIQC